MIVVNSIKGRYPIVAFRSAKERYIRGAKVDTSCSNNPMRIVRIFFLAIVLAIDLCASTPTIYAQPPLDAADEVDRCINKALNFLVTKQREDGAITDSGYSTAMSALAIMSMASTGTTTTDPTPRGQSMRKALEYCLKDELQDVQGYFGKKDESRMYGHGIITLMLTEMIGMGATVEQDRKIHEKCRNGIDLILRSQQVAKQSIHQGGWRYTPDATDSDLSVSVWQLMALRSAKNDGMDVPSGAIDDAIEYLDRSFTVPLNGDGTPREPLGGFGYTAGDRRATYTMTSAGLLAYQVCGQYDSPLVSSASNWLLENPPKWGDRFFFYGTYYYAQGMYQRGTKYASTADENVRRILLEQQKPEGKWEPPGGEESGIGSVYATSMAVLSLSVKYHYLPIYQR